MQWIKNFTMHRNDRVIMRFQNIDLNMRWESTVWPDQVVFLRSLLGILQPLWLVLEQFSQVFHIVYPCFLCSLAHIATNIREQKTVQCCLLSLSQHIDMFAVLNARQVFSRELPQGF